VIMGHNRSNCNSTQQLDNIVDFMRIFLLPCVEFAFDRTK
jgi:hypothetical protein